MTEATTEQQLTIGQEFPGVPGSVYAGSLTNREGQLYALVLLAERAQDKTHAQALKWAQKLGADLPTRVEASMLFAHVKASLPGGWHWTNESYGSSCAWFCSFGGGSVGYGTRTAEGGAVALRRLPLDPSILQSVAA